MKVYAYDWMLEDWYPIAESSVNITNQTVEFMYQGNHWPMWSGIYTVGVDKRVPKTPVLFLKLNKIENKYDVIFGKCSAFSIIEANVNGKKYLTLTSTGTKWDSFIITNVEFKKGTNYICLKAKTYYGRESNISCYTLIYKERKPIKMNSIKFKDIYGNIIEKAHSDEKILVEGIGTNFYLDRNEFIEVKVKSSITSSNGITIKLMEISENTNIYRGVFSLKDVSREFSSELGVRKNNEVIEAIILDNTNIRDRLIFIDTSPPSAPQIYANFIYPAQDTFEHNLDNWQNRCGETGAKVEKVQRVHNNYCIKITSQVDRGNSSVYVLQKSFSAK